MFLLLVSHSIIESCHCSLANICLRPFSAKEWQCWKPKTSCQKNSNYKAPKKSLQIGKCKFNLWLILFISLFYFSFLRKDLFLTNSLPSPGYGSERRLGAILEISILILRPLRIICILSLIGKSSSKCCLVIIVPTFLC